MTTSEVLEQRLRAGEPSRVVGAVLALVAHGGFILFLVLISKPRPATFVPLSVPVRIVSPAALGSPAPPQPPPAEKPAEKPAPPKARPVIEKPNEKPVPSKEAMPLPKPSKEKTKPTPAPPGPPSKGEGAPSLELPSALGSPAGEAGGTTNFGASVAGFDSDFPFAYYVEQLQSLIGANWLKPNVPDGTACVVNFQIQRSGQITDVKLESSSGLPFYDRAAARAVYAANPLPPLPPEFPGERLGVHLKFQ